MSSLSMGPMSLSQAGCTQTLSGATGLAEFYRTHFPLRAGLKGSAMPRAPSPGPVQRWRGAAQAPAGVSSPSCSWHRALGQRGGGGAPRREQQHPQGAECPHWACSCTGAAPGGAVGEASSRALSSCSVVRVLNESLVLNSIIADTPERQRSALFSWLCLKKVIS